MVYCYSSRAIYYGNIDYKFCNKDKAIQLTSSFSKVKFKGFKVFYDTNNNTNNEKEIDET